ncbi:hypothetical protein HDV02_003203 [Globomyces sp. JEL0801]|nr:hypothetical protein HDV02_003203 [Globomyces sp. JEL0801]
MSQANAIEEDGGWDFSPASSEEIIESKAEVFGSNPILPVKVKRYARPSIPVKVLNPIPVLKKANSLPNTQSTDKRGASPASKPPQVRPHGHLRSSSRASLEYGQAPSNTSLEGTTRSELSTPPNINRMLAIDNSNGIEIITASDDVKVPVPPQPTPPTSGSQQHLSPRKNINRPNSREASMTSLQSLPESENETQNIARPPSGGRLTPSRNRIRPVSPRLYNNTNLLPNEVRPIPPILSSSHDSSNSKLASSKEDSPSASFTSIDSVKGGKVVRSLGKIKQK